MSVNKEFVKRYVDVISKAPPVGSILQTVDGSVSLLRVEIEHEKPPFIYGRAYPIEAVGDRLGWYLRSLDDERNTGYKCILLCAARRAIIKAFPDEFAWGKIPVKSLKVVRVSNTGQSLLCEICKYGIDDVKLSEVLPLDANFDTQEAALQHLRDAKWVLGSRNGGQLEFCIDPNGTKVNVIL